MAIRGVEERLAYYLRNKPAEGGWCALKVMQALGASPQGLPDATAVANVVLKAGRMKSGRAPRGAIVYWKGGSAGHGHVCFALGDGTERSVDVKGPGTVGDVPFSWFARNWGDLDYVGWSWYWGGINTEPVKAAVEPKPAPARKGKTTTGSKVTWWRDFSGKPEAKQTVAADGKWHRIEGIDVAAPTVSGAETHFLYLRLALTWLLDATGPCHIETKWVRDGGTPNDTSDDDPTAYAPAEFGARTLSTPLYDIHPEEGQKGVGGSWWINVRAGDGLESVTLSTRYAKTSVIAVA